MATPVATGAPRADAPVVPHDVIAISTDTCDRSTIIASRLNRNAIRRTASRAGARVVDTNQLSNLRNGLYAAVFGPDPNS